MMEHGLIERVLVLFAGEQRSMSDTRTVDRGFFGYQTQTRGVYAGHNERSAETPRGSGI